MFGKPLHLRVLQKQDKTPVHKFLLAILMAMDYVTD